VERRRRLAAPHLAKRTFSRCKGCLSGILKNTHVCVSRLIPATSPDRVLARTIGPSTAPRGPCGTPREE
jgi:hypothetical protein